MRTLLLATVFLLVGATASAQATRQIYKHLEEGAEVTQLALTANDTQLIYTRACDECPMLSLSVTPETKLYDGRRRINIARAAALIERGATVFFDPATRKVNRIVYWK